MFDIGLFDCDRHPQLSDPAGSSAQKNADLEHAYNRRGIDIIFEEQDRDLQLER